jgi:hypothetical protein
MTVVLLMIFFAVPLFASEGEKPVHRDYASVRAGPAPQTQEREAAEVKSTGCTSCHTATDQVTMHATEAVVLGCTDCHGGNPAIRGDPTLAHTDPRYIAARDKAHVLPRYPKAWHWPSSANPQQSYALLNRESPEFIRFVNPSDYRVVRESCGGCHMETVEAAERSLMSTGAMFWAAAAYNNGILPFKTPLLGEAYTRDGEPAKIVSPFTTEDKKLTDEQRKKGALAELYPLPTWQVVPPGDIFRVFERGGRTIGTQFAEIGLPSPSGSIQKLEESGRPDIRQSNRGPGTGLRVAIPILNIHKTRLNDPFLWFMGTNDQPGDYRHSGCAGCHVIYANDREPTHSLGYTQYGRDGQTATIDPTIAGKTESGHPIRHAFTRAIPTSQCMNCHMHQPNIFLNSFLGYTMWDYEADADLMWPGPENRLPAPPGKEQVYRKQHYPGAEEERKILDRNPEGAAARGLWGDVDFLRNVADDVNPRAQHTQFADYHGHGWNFRAIYKRDRAGNLLDAEGNIVSPEDPEKFRKAGEGQFVPPDVNPGKAVHLMDIHAEKGMQCADCHFGQDSHGNGFIMGEVPDAIEIACKDCHGTATEFPNLLTSGPAAPPKGTNLALLRNADGQRRFEWIEESGQRVLIQRSIVDPNRSWRVSLVKDSVDPANPHFNIKAARAKLMSKQGADTGRYVFGSGVPEQDLAHKPSEMACYSCHLSWTTSCGGCHLPIEANWKTAVHRYEGEETRNFATYNPQVARDDMFQLGRHMTTKGNIIAPVRSSSALMLSSTNINRERIYVQQPPISAVGFSSQAFAPHFPHTVRKAETKTCIDCHLSAANDNNAIMAQLLLQGTNFVNFVGMNAFVGMEDGFQATRVTEWDEPQAVIGSYLHRFAYPDFYRLHVDRNKRELINWTRAIGTREKFANIVQATGGAVHCLQNRGEYMYVAQGSAGFRVYDMASIANKGVSERIVTAPFSKLGQNTHIATKNATCMALPTNQPIAPYRNTPAMQQANQEQPFHPIYNYAVITDSEEGLILVDINTFADGNPLNNFIKRAVTWNENGVLKGARHITLAGHIAYITTPNALVVVDLDDPLKPRLAARLELRDPRASAIQFRYLWVTDAEGLELFDATKLDSPRPIPSATVPLKDARKVYVARTYAYVAGKREGLAIVDVTNPETPRVERMETFGGQMNDAEDVVVASTNASLFAYVADGRNGMKVIQLFNPASQPNFYGFSPAPRPELIAWARTPRPALALAKGLDRDRAVDETGGQIAIFGRIGSRPFTRAEMERLFLGPRGIPFMVSDTASMDDWVR